MSTLTVSVLYADRDLLICRKPAGMPAQPDPSGQADLLSLVTARHPTAHLVHRLDTPTGGVMVLGLTPVATARLCALVQDHARFCKDYLAVVSTPPLESTGELRDHLFHDKRLNKSFVVDSDRKGAKEAVLLYRTLATIPDGHTLLAIRLCTGRTHQIRVQFASRGLPLVGDGKYGSREKCSYIGLWAAHLTLPHPMTGKIISVETLPNLDSLPWSHFRNVIDNQPLLYN